MGMYTAHIGTAKIKPEYYGLVRGMLRAQRDFYHRKYPALREELEVAYPCYAELACTDRWDCLFYWMTGDSHMDWGKLENPTTFKDGVLSWGGCFKNYDGEIDKFANLLETISTSFSLQDWYEEEEAPRTYLGKGAWTAHSYRWGM